MFPGNCYSSDFKSLHNLMLKYPQLIKYSSSIDHYQPWPFEAYVKMANVWLQDERSKVIKQFLSFLIARNLPNYDYRAVSSFG